MSVSLSLSFIVVIIMVHRVIMLMMITVVTVFMIIVNIITNYTTVRCRYNAINFLSNPPKIHPIARPIGRGMGCLLEIQPLIDTLPQLRQRCVQYHVVLNRVITALDCTIISIIIIDITIVILLLIIIILIIRIMIMILIIIYREEGDSSRGKTTLAICCIILMLY